VRASGAAKLTFNAMEDLERSGSTHDEAWQATRSLYLLPPGEPDENPEPMPQSTTIAHEAIAELMRSRQQQDED
jgi:hypothetical protein